LVSPTSFSYFTPNNANFTVEEIENRRTRREMKNENAEQEEGKLSTTTLPESSIKQNPQDENSSRLSTPETTSKAQAAPRQEIGEFYHIRRENTGGSAIQTEQNGVNTNLSGAFDIQNAHMQDSSARQSSTSLASVISTSNSPDPQLKDERHQGPVTNLPRMNTVELERGRRTESQISSSESSTVEFEVEKKLYDSWWFVGWLLACLVTVLVGTTIAANNEGIFI
jgi:hypothetical protein